MPLNIPSLDALVQSSRASMEINLPGSDANLKGPEMAISDTLAGDIHDGMRIAQKASYDTVPNPFMSDEAALIFKSGLGIPHGEATFSTGKVLVTGTDGIPVPAGSLLQANNGNQYEFNVTDAPVGGQVEMQITALLAGKDGNLIDGQKLVFLEP